MNQKNEKTYRTKHQYLNYIQNSQNWTIKQNPIRKRTIDIKEIFIEESIEMVNKMINSTLPAIKIKTAMGYHHITIRLAKIKNHDNTK